MTVETLTPTSREEWLAMRKSTVGASEVAALFGVHPWLTPYELWARKSGLVPEAEETPAMRRGRFLEAVAIECLREERPDWIIKANPIPGGVFYRDSDVGLSCTPDAFVMDAPPQGSGICQIKSVEPHVFKRTWMPDNTGAGPEAPLYVAIQAIQEAMLIGASWACLGALVVGHGIDLHLIDIALHAGLWARIRNQAADFWRRVRENDPYPPDYARDGAVIRNLYAEDDRGITDFSFLEVEPYNRLLKLVARREAMTEIESAARGAEKERKTIDAELIHMLGNSARGILVDGRVIEAVTVRKKGFVVEPTVFRQVKLKQRKIA